MILLIMFFSSIVFGSMVKDTIYFKSANPFSFKNIIEGSYNQGEQIVFGVLTIPSPNIRESDKIPLIIGVAGSVNWASHHLEYLEMYQNMGIATFELQSFNSRSVDSTVGSQVEVTAAMMILDSYRALEELSGHPMIDKNRVAITGWSLGGGVSLFSAWMPLKNAINKELKFAAHLSYYPPCIVEPTILNFSDSPIRLLVGELDDWVPAEACLDLASKIKNNGSDIEVIVYENAHHSFDKKALPKVVKNGYKLKDCRLKMSSDGAVRMNFLNIPMTTPLLQKIGLALCTNGIFAERGPTFGGNPIARQASFKFSKDFMQKELLD